jgi:hypothetical protein
VAPPVVLPASPALTSPTDPLAVLRHLARDLGGRPTSAQLDAVLCLLEAAQHLLPAVEQNGRVLKQEEVDEIRSCVRAASLSVRSFLCRIGNGNPRRAEPQGL